jgi:hypothetical protein
MNRTIIQGRSALVAPSAHGVVVTIEEAILPEPVMPAEIGSEVSAYDTVDEYACHRGLCSKTVRTYLHLIPHSTVGGIRILRKEADGVLDNLQRPPRSRRKPKNSQNEN